MAVETTSAQLTWGALRPGSVDIGVDGEQVSSLISGGGPHVVELGDLTPATSHRVTVTSFDATKELAIDTLSDLGPELYRFATLSDLHIGRSHFGIRTRIREHDPDELHPTRCARSALEDIERWGAQRLIIKGDVVEDSRPHSWAEAAALLNEVSIPIHLIAGNHEARPRATVDPYRHAKLCGLDLQPGVRSIDVRGARLVLMDSSVPGIDIGRWHHLYDDAVAAVGSTTQPCMVFVHHQPQFGPFPTYLPRGIADPGATRFIRSLVDANPNIFGSSGHTHRNRKHTIGGAVWTEVGSPKDYPGSWAGYVVYERGIRQVVRRPSSDTCLDWLERTFHAAAGAWGLWSPGTLAARCFVHEWPSVNPA